MKKILMVGVLALSAVIYATGEVAVQPASGMGMMQGQGMQQTGMGMMNGNKGCPMMQKGMMGGRMMQGGMMNMNPAQRQAMEKDMITMEEKKLEIRKLMNTEKPDWKKIEKLNGDIASMRAKHMTSMMQNMHESVNK